MLQAKTIILQDNLQHRPLGRNNFVKSRNFIAHILPLTTEDFANINDHFDLGSAGLRRGGGLKDFDFRCAVSMWKTDDGADEDI
jgi:hypothetical protein